MRTKIRTVNCFGDSGVYGSGDREAYIGWAGRLRREFHALNEVDIEYGSPAAFHILGILGNSSLRILERAEQERAVRRGKSVLNILSIGTNDAIVTTDGSPFVGELEYAKALRAIGDIFTANDQSMLYVGLTSFDDRYTTRFRGKEINCRKDRTRLYESIALDVYAEMGIPSVPLFDASDTEQYLTTMLDVDKLHPNTAGHQWVYEKVLPVALQMWGTLEKLSV